MTAFSETAERLIARGYSVIPIIPGEKRPGAYSGGSWHGMKDWQRYCDRAPTRFELDMWATWPSPSICVPLGRASNLTAIDYDYGSDELRAELKALLPESPVRKTGAKGETAFFRGYSHVPKKFLCDGASVVELLGHGRQTVLPPSIHPDGMAYRWLTEKTLENTSVGELPTIPIDYYDRVAEVIARHQTQPVVKDKPIHTPIHTKSSGGDGNLDTIWAEVNKLALENIQVWVPRLFDEIGPGADGGLRVNPTWRKVTKLTKKVGIHPTGIVDFGTGETFSPLDIVMKVTGADIDTAYKWLTDALGVSQGTVFTPEALDEPPPAEAPPEATIIPFAKPSVAKPMPWHKKAAGRDVNTSGPVSTRAVGALGMLANYITETAYSPQPILDLGASICALGTLAGRKYKSPTGLRTNMYVVGLADSGAGKDHARGIIDKIFSENLGEAQRLGGDKIASGAGLLSAIKRCASILFQIDEFGAVLQGIANRQKAPQHLAEILHYLTQLFTTSNGTFRGIEYANQKERPREEIVNPCLSIYGTTVPSNFWKALESNSAVDGSLARFIVCESALNYPDIQNPVEKEPPFELIDLLKRISASIGGVGGHLHGTLTPELMTVAYSDEATKMIRDLQVETLNRQRTLEGTQYTAFVARRMELIIKVAMIQAIGLNPENPVIGIEDVNFGMNIVDPSIKLMIDGVERYVADNIAEGYAKRVIEILRKAPNGLSKSELYHKTHFLGRDRENALRS